MSEVTYKKIVDVEQIDTLGEGTTLFVNDGGSMKQMGAAALGAVKSVNGVLPDENGNVEDKHLHYIRFLDGSAMVPGMIQCAEYSAVQIRDAFGDAYERPIVIERLVMSASGTTRSVYCQNYTIERDDDGYIYHLNFGDEYADIILNTVLNTITLDPDWVKPEENVQPDWNQNDPNAPDYVKNRTHWEEVTEAVTEVPDTTFTSTIDAGQGVAMLSVAPNVTAIGDKREIIYDGVSYVCEAAEFQYTPGALYLGNASIMGAGDDSGEPFFWMINSKTSTTFVNTDTVATAHTVSCKTVRVETIHTIDPKYLPEDHINSLIDSNEKITALTEELKGNGPHQMLVTGADGSTKWEDRTHYENTFEFVYADNVSFEVSEEDPLVVFPFVIDEIIEGQTYKVTWDGIVYELVAAKQQVPGGIGIGIGNYELPFLILSMDGVTGAFVNGPGTHTISLSTVKTEIIKIPEKYLPDEIMYEESVLNLPEVKQWSSSYDNDANFIINYKGVLKQGPMSLLLDGANNLGLYLTDEVDADGHRKVTLGSGADYTGILQQQMITGVITITEVLRESSGNSICFYSPVVGYNQNTDVLYYFDKNGEYKGCVTKIDNAT